MSRAAPRHHGLASQDGEGREGVEPSHTGPPPEEGEKTGLTRGGAWLVGGYLVVINQAAIHGSSLDDVLFLDSDSVPATSDPSWLFHTHEYKTTGQTDRQPDSRMRKAV